MADGKMSQFFKEGKDCGRKVTSIPGVFLIKLQEYRSRPSCITMEIKPVDTSWMATRKRGVLIRSHSEPKQTSNILTRNKIMQLTDSIDDVNPKKKTKPMSTETHVFEI
jgi:hypothetical protein